jgi:anthranilate phosphoribosyltransferase
MTLKEVAPLIRKISERQDLSAEEAQFAFDTCTLEDADSYYFLALMLGLHTKGETSDELLGLCRSSERFSPPMHVTPEIAQNLIDLSGTGGAAQKTFNVSTAASFVLAGAGVFVAKQSGPAVTGVTGSADVASAFGIDLTGKFNSPERVVKTLAEVGIVQFFLPYMSPEFKYRAKLYPRLREIGLTFIMPVHLAAFAFHPMRPKKRIYGMFTDRYLVTLAELFQKLGYEHGLTFYGEPGLCEISNVGKTHIVEYTTSTIRDYWISPEDLGIKTANLDDIRAGGKEQNIQDFVRVLYGIDTGPRRDLVLVNAAAAFYVMGRSSSIQDGVKLGASVIESGAASAKLEEFVRLCGDPDRLEETKRKAAIP